MLLDDLVTYLESLGYRHVFRTQFPDTPDNVISVHEREAPLAFGASGIHYGARVAPVSIRVRRKTLEEAEREAWALFALLDSGPEEQDILLTPQRRTTCRPKAPPFFLEIDAKERCTYVVKVNIHTGAP